MTGQTVVLGAGIAGLTAAATLVRAGAPVAVYDTVAEIGGRARSTFHDGTPLNLGAHAMYMHGPGISVLRDLGVPLGGGSPPLSRARLLINGTLVRPTEATRGGSVNAAWALTRLALARATRCHPS